MTFFTSLYKSLYDVSWLKANKANRGGGWKYFFGFVALVMLVVLAGMAVSLFRVVPEIRSRAADSIPEFEATFKEGELSVTGLKQPYTYRGEDEDSNKFVVMVDTVSTSTPDLDSILEDDESGLLVTKEKVEFFDANQNNGRTQFFDEMPDTSFNRARILGWIQKFLSPVFIILLLGIIGLFVFIGLIIGKLFLIVIVSLIALIVARIAKRQWQWNELFTVGLFAITLPSLVSLVLPFFGVATGHIPFLILTAFMLALVLTKDETTAPAAGQNPPPPEAK
jgi:hypothetical protein